MVFGFFVVLFLSVCLGFFKYHYPNTITTPPTLVAWDLPTTIYLKNHSFIFLSFHPCLAMLWLLYKCEMRRNAFPSDDLSGKGKVLPLVCDFGPFGELMHQALAEVLQ